MDSHHAHAAEAADARRIRGRVFLIRNLLCGAALLGGGIAGLMSLQDAREKNEADRKAAGTPGTVSPATVLVAHAAAGPIAVNRTVISGWKDKGRLLNSPEVASELAGRPMSLSRRSIDTLPINREWDYPAEEMLKKAAGEVKSDPVYDYVDTSDIAKASAKSTGRQYSERFPHVTAMADITADIPASGREQWREAVGHAEQAVALMAKARVAGTNAERFGMYSVAKQSLRKGLEVLSGLEQSAESPHWAYSVAGELLRSMLMDCNKGAHSG